MIRVIKMKRNEGNACPYMVVSCNNPSKTPALIKPILFSDKSLKKRNLKNQFSEISKQATISTADNRDSIFWTLSLGYVFNPFTPTGFPIDE